MHEAIIEQLDTLAAVYPDFRWIHHSPNEARTIGRALHMKRLGCRPGVLDLEWPLRRAAVGVDGGRSVLSGLAVELKAGKNQLTSAQRDRASWLERNGWRVLVCRSVTEAVDAFIAYYQLEDAQ